MLLYCTLLHSNALHCTCTFQFLVHCTALYFIPCFVHHNGSRRLELEQLQIQQHPTSVHPVIHVFVHLVGSGRRVFFMQLSSDLTRQNSNMNGRQNHVPTSTVSSLKPLKNLILGTNNFTQISQIQSRLLYYAHEIEIKQLCDVLSWHIVKYPTLDWICFLFIHTRCRSMCMLKVKLLGAYCAISPANINHWITRVRLCCDTMSWKRCDGL